AVPLAADAQQRTPVIGYLGSGSPEPFAGRLDAFRQGLSTTGNDEGGNMAIEYRWAEATTTDCRRWLAELACRDVTVIAAPGSLVCARGKGGDHEHSLGSSRLGPTLWRRDLLRAETGQMVISPA